MSRTTSFTVLSALLALCCSITHAVQCKPGCNPRQGYCVEPGECRCQPGWEGEFCERCTSYPGCVHGSCQQPWQCNCEPGWVGRFCNKDLNHCANAQPCKNNGSCMDNGAGSFTCLCPPGFTGKVCEKRTGPCYMLGTPCLNGGTCEDANGWAEKHTCICRPGYLGERCELTAQIDACSGLCANGARCHVLPGHGPRCECAPGFGGRLCMKHLPCSSIPHDAPCVNGGKCADVMDGTFHCICPWGFFGKRCEQHTDTRVANITNNLLIHNEKVKLESPAQHKQSLLHITLMQTQADHWGAYSKTWWLVLGLLATFVLMVLGSVTGILYNARCGAWATRVLRSSRLPPLEGQHDELLQDNLVCPARLKLTNQQRAAQTRTTTPLKELA
uniref:protein delta homolog 1-like n=1 Tax=Myxine glutinosa TaxID=7769 RepID=UPI00358F40B0